MDIKKELKEIKNILEMLKEDIRVFRLVRGKGVMKYLYLLSRL